MTSLQQRASYSIADIVLVGSCQVDGKLASRGKVSLGVYQGKVVVGIAGLREYSARLHISILLEALEQQGLLWRNVPPNALTEHLRNQGVSLLGGCMFTIANQMISLFGSSQGLGALPEDLFGNEASDTQEILRGFLQQKLTESRSI